MVFIGKINHILRFCYENVGFTFKTQKLHTVFEIKDTLNIFSDTKRCQTINQDQIYFQFSHI